LFFGHLTDENTHLDKIRDGCELEAELGACPWPATRSGPARHRVRDPGRRTPRPRRGHPGRTRTSPRHPDWDPPRGYERITQDPRQWRVNSTPELDQARPAQRHSAGSICLSRDTLKLARTAADNGELFLAGAFADPRRRRRPRLQGRRQISRRAMTSWV